MSYSLQDFLDDNQVGYGQRDMNVITVGKKTFILE